MELGFMGCSKASGRVQGQNCRNSSYLKVLKIWKVDSGLFYIRQVLKNKQIAIWKDYVKDLPLVEKVCYFKNGLNYPHKISKTILYISLLKLRN